MFSFDKSAKQDIYYLSTKNHPAAIVHILFIVECEQWSSVANYASYIIAIIIDYHFLILGDFQHWHYEQITFLAFHAVAGLKMLLFVILIIDIQMWKVGTTDKFTFYLNLLFCMRFWSI